MSDGYLHPLQMMPAPMRDGEASRNAQSQQLHDRLLRAIASAVAQQALANCLVDELTAEAQGRLASRQLSDPYNREGRLAYLATVEERELQRLSRGRLHVAEGRLHAAKGPKP